MLFGQGNVVETVADKFFGQLGKCCLVSYGNIVWIVAEMSFGQLRKHPWTSFIFHILNAQAIDITERSKKGLTFNFGESHITPKVVFL